MDKLINKRTALIARVKAELPVIKDLHHRNPSRSEVMDRLDQLKQQADAFRAIQDEFEEQLEDPQAIASVFNVREEFFCAYYTARSILEDLVDDTETTASQKTVADSSDWREAMKLLMETQRQMLLNQSAMLNNSSKPAAQGDAKGSQVLNGSHPNVKLPAINIPVFSGDRKKWMTFKDIYVSTIHDREDITDSLKMQYLFSYLDGDAKNLVNKFTISSVNYTKAWETLNSHYDKKRYTVFALMREFMEQPVVTQTSLQSLNKLVMTLDEVVQQLDVLGEEYQGRDPWLIYLVLEKLDKDTRAAWSEKVVDNENPTFEELMEFVKKRCEMLETCSAFSTKGEVKKEQVKMEVIEKKLKTLVATAVNQQCAKCSSEHATFVCGEFKKMNLQERRDLAKQARLCFNCLRALHPAKSCPSKSVCHTPDCNQRHHTLLCPTVNKEKEPSTAASNDPATDDEEPVISSLMAAVEHGPTIPVFPTAVVQVRKEDGTFGRARVLIDSGAQASMITEDCVRKLGLVRRSGKLPITGIGQQAAGTTRGVVTLHLASRFDEVVVISTSAYVLGKLTSSLPSQRFNIRNLKLLENVSEMADPTFNKPGPIDVILGADVFLALLEGGQVKDSSGQTVAQRTVFGWIAAGRYDGADTVQENHVIVSLHTEMDLNRTLQQLGEYEEISKPLQCTPSEKVIEHFNSTTQRDGSGRFADKPLDDSKPALGKSLSTAMEKRLTSNPEFQKEIDSFMQEHGRMEPIHEEGHQFLRIEWRAQSNKPVARFCPPLVKYGMKTLAVQTTKNVRLRIQMWMIRCRKRTRKKKLYVTTRNLRKKLRTRYTVGRFRFGKAPLLSFYLADAASRVLWGVPIESFKAASRIRRTRHSVNRFGEMHPDTSGVVQTVKLRRWATVYQRDRAFLLSVEVRGLKVGEYVLVSSHPSTCRSSNMRRLNSTLQSRRRPTNKIK